MASKNHANKIKHWIKNAEKQSSTSSKVDFYSLFLFKGSRQLPEHNKHGEMQCTYTKLLCLKIN